VPGPLLLQILNRIFGIYVASQGLSLHYQYTRPLRLCKSPQLYSPLYEKRLSLHEKE